MTSNRSLVNECTISKENSDESISRFKARWIAHNYRQIEEDDYKEKYVSIIRSDMSRILLSITAILDWKIRQFDDKSVFLNEVMNWMIYIVQSKVLRRFMIEKYSSKNIDDKKLISIKSNLIYWFEYWLFDVLQLTSIEIYLYFTIYEMNNFDVELDSYLSRFHVVKWISRDETLHELFNKTFVLRFFAHFMIRSLKIWT
jgi:hypothetical protein